MPGDLDNILAQLDCSRCGTSINVPWKQVRLHKGCGVSLWSVYQLEDDTPMAALQRVIDEANPPSAESDL